MSKKNIEYINLLKEDFNEEIYIGFIKDLINLSSDDINANYEEIVPSQKQYKEDIKYYKFFAKYNDGINSIGSFIVNIRSTNERNKQRNFVATLLNQYNLDAALVAFISDNDSSWRISFVRKELSFTDKGVKQELTPARRYSYLVGKNESVHTAQEYLLKLLDIEDRKIKIEDIESVFDVEKVTKRFFEQYKEQFLKLHDYLEKNEDFKTESIKYDFDSVEFAKRLMGQIVFLYFLQKKGWLGVQLVPNELSLDEYNNLINSTDSVCQKLLNGFYEKKENIYQIDRNSINDAHFDDIRLFTEIFKNSKYDSNWGTGDKSFIRTIYKYAQITHKNFFDEILEPFFYEGLNTPRKELNDYFQLFNCKIPFLNGGLFEPLNNYDWHSSIFNIPNKFFSNDNEDGILDFLDLYNFTIDEEEPLEKEIAVDPEMLGKIFENLLEINDRKSKGAFYTPREIVYYMCQESLANYLVNKVGVDYNETIQFIKYGDLISHVDWDKSNNGDYSFELGKTIYDKLLEVDKALKNVKVADPAVGSGAFPLGMLTEIVKARDVISTYIIIKHDINQIDDYTYNELINNDRSLYSLKKETIENCIYSVDIELSAIDIAKLRLWLSLIVEYPNNLEPKPLPNLDCKIMQGNSLIDEYEGISLFSEKMFKNSQRKNAAHVDVQQNIFGEVKEIIIQQSFDLGYEPNIGSYFENMMRLQKEFFSASDPKLKKELKTKIDDIQIAMIERSLMSSKTKLESFKKIARKRQKPWFIWKLEFFDVFKENGGFDIVIGNPPYVNIENIPKSDKKIYSKSFQSAFQKYDLYVLFYELGLNLVNENGTLCYITSNKFLSQGYGVELRKLMLDNTLKRIINFNYDVFESATVRTAIILLQKSKPGVGNKIDIIDVNTKEEKRKFVNEQYAQILQKTFKEIENNNFRINLTLDKINVLRKIENNTIPLNSICSVNYGLRPSSEEKKLKKEAFIHTDNPLGIYKPYFEGKDMGYWKIKTYKYLDYQPKIMYNAMFKELFEYEKLVGLRTLSDIGKLRFIYDNAGFYCNDSTVVLTLWNKFQNINYVTIKRTIDEEKIEISKRYNYEYIQGILNSKLMKFYFNELYYDGTHFYPNHMKVLPIKVFCEDSKIEEIVKQLRNSDDNGLLNELDKAVYNLYSLTDEEISLIEESLKIIE